MENKINIAEILKDCPKGTKLYSPICGECELVEVIKNKQWITVKDNEDIPTSFYANGTQRKYGECMLFPSKDNRVWNTFQKPFKDGDIIFTHANCLKVGLGNTWISIFKEYRNNGVDTYIDYNTDGDKDFYTCIDGDKGFLCMKEDILCQRLATEEEKQKLFDAIKANGYKWNSLTKTLEPKFKNGDVVVSGAGNIALFSHTANMYDKPIIYYHCILSPYICIDSKLEIGIDCGIGGVEDCYLASNEQKERLFNALKEKGYKWNPDTKSLEKLIVPKFKVEDKIQNKKRKKERRTIKLCENDGYWTTEDSWIRINEQDDWELVPNKFDISTLKPFESKVLVRDSSDCIWKPAIFGFSHRIGCCAVGGASWNQVIPYEGNEHLLKTNNDCDEYYKNW